MSRPPSFSQFLDTAALVRTFDEDVSESSAIGLDGIKLSQFSEHKFEILTTASRKISLGTYEFTRFREKLISRGSQRTPRVVAIPTIRDRVVLRALNKFLKTRLGDAIIPRPHSFVKNIKDYLVECSSEHVFVRGDIQSFYDNVEHRDLIRRLRRRIRTSNALYLIERALVTPVGVQSGRSHGIPQGLSISNILANYYLLDFDAEMKKRAFFVRYVDDFLFIANSNEGETVFREAQTYLNRLDLKIHPIGDDNAKSEIADVEDGINYLGFRISRNCISVMDRNRRKMLNSIVGIFREYMRTGNEPRLILKLTIRIRGCKFNERKYGWLLFFAQLDDKKLLKRLDNFVSGQFLRYSISGVRKHVPTFTRAYHQIRYELQDSGVLIDFDEFDVAQKRSFLVRFTSRSEQEINAMRDEAIGILFRRTVRRETRRMDEELDWQQS